MGPDLVIVTEVHGNLISDCKFHVVFESRFIFIKASPQFMGMLVS